MSTLFNKSVLMSGAEYFNDNNVSNVLMDSSIEVNVAAAMKEHALIGQTLTQAGVEVNFMPAPAGCEDGVYTANWALIYRGKALMSRLPNTRKDEEPFAKRYLEQLGLETLVLPDHVKRFSGQGDALPCGNIVFTQSPFRTTTDAHPYLKDWLGFEHVIALETLSALGEQATNPTTGWPDSPTYDIDLAISILKWPSKNQKGLIAYCPAVFTEESQQVLKDFNLVDKIEVSHDEAMGAYAMNLVSTGEMVVMNAGAPDYTAAIETYGLTVMTLDLPELKKGGGSIRCTTLTMDNL